MNKQLKVALAVIAGAAVIGGIVTVAVYLIARQFANRTFTTDPTQAARIGHEIINYTLPPGYREQNASSTPGDKMVTISPQSGVTNAMTIVLVERLAPPGMSREDIIQQTNQSLDNEDIVVARIVSTQTVTIHGQPVTLTIYDTEEAGHLTHRTVFGLFPGKGNTLAAIYAIGAQDAWDQAALDSFLDSIK